MAERSHLVCMHVKNIGCIGNDGLTVELDDIVCLVGANNAGKTTVLRAYELAVKQLELKPEDFNRNSNGNPASVELWVPPNIYRSENIKFCEEDKNLEAIENLKALMLFDANLSEMCLGGRVVSVEGDTEFAAFQEAMRLEEAIYLIDHSTERDFIYVTTANLNHEQLQALNDEVGANSFARGDEGRANEFAPTRTLLVLCTAFRGRGDYPNLTVKKIPKQVLSRCEWGHDDYSLQVENLPKAAPSPPAPLPQAGEGRKAKSANAAQGGLFEEGEA